MFGDEAEDDWNSFPSMTRRQGDRVKIVGDDIYVTDTKFIPREGEQCRFDRAEPGRIATVQAVHSAGWREIVQHHSGETTDTFISDLNVALGCGHSKAGSPLPGQERR